MGGRWRSLACFQENKRSDRSILDDVWCNQVPWLNGQPRKLQV
jgi:hypothetical protein